MSLGGYADIFLRNTLASGVVPQISAILGPCAGGAVYSPAITDFVFMVRGVSYMFVTGPNVVKTVTHEEVSFDELGGADTHGGTSGVAHFVHDSEPECLAAIRELVGYPPAQQPRRSAASAPPRTRRTAGTRRSLDLIPDESNKPYDMHGVIGRVVDEGDFLEVHRGYADNIIVGLRPAGRPAGRDRGQPAGGARRRARHQRLAQGRAVHPVLRLLQPAGRHLRGRAGVPARRGPGARRHHQARRQAAVRLLRGHRAEAHRHHPQGLRRGLRRHELQAHPGRPEPRLAVGRDRGHGAQGRGGDPLQGRDRPGRRPGGRHRPADRRVHRASSRIRTPRRRGATSTTSSTRATPGPA